MNASPWWYRWRGYVMMAIYLVGFFPGWTLWTLAGQPDVPAYGMVMIGLGMRDPLWEVVFITLCMVACFAIRVWGSSYLSAATVWNRDALQNTLTVAGPFRFMRNPLYLGNILMSIAFGLLASPLGFAIIVIGNALFLVALARYEARGLEAQFGATYLAYAKAVPSFYPRLTPVTIPGTTSVAPSLVQGVKSEIFSGCCAIATIAFLVLGGATVWPLPFFLILVLGWVAQALLTRRRATPPSAAPSE